MTEKRSAAEGITELQRSSRLLLEKLEHEFYLYRDLSDSEGYNSNVACIFNALEELLLILDQRLDALESNHKE